MSRDRRGFRSSDNLASCGGVFHDHNGAWLIGFPKSIGICETGFARYAFPRLVLHVSHFMARQWEVHVVDGLAKLVYSDSRCVNIFEDHLYEDGLGRGLNTPD
ncbi:hypothetical protein V6N12_067090 [Hibiscus sabdariffa]|uniref:Uncharacterized protein n=1 Tax=Hibiscus sabdariffa TaxID=183260 RepID=A0ABR1ZML3_9ROSI